MIVIQAAIIIFLLLVVLIVYQDDYRKRELARKTAKLDRFWDSDNASDGDKERRKSIRIATKISVSYEVISTSAEKKRISVSNNISKGGINLALDEKLLPNTTMDLQLNLPNRSRPIHARGKIIWVKEIPHEFTGEKGDRYFATGIQFIQMLPRHEVILHKFIDQQIKDAHEQSKKV